MSANLTPSKRPHDHGASEANGKGKWQKSAYFTSLDTSFKIAPGSTVFRVLCPASKAGSVIGKGGDKISQIRQESGAKVRVEETVPGCNERVVVIAGSDEENGFSSSQSKNADEGPKETQATEDTDNAKEHDKGDDHNQSVAGEDLQFEKVASSVQKALFLVFERMFGGESAIDGGQEDGNTEATACVVRLLVPASQVGRLLGKAGSIIKQMASESGSQIRIIPRDKLPVCVSSSEELIQISGDMDAVRKALQSVSQQLLDHPPCDGDSFSAKRSGSSGNTLSRPDAFPAFPHGRQPFAADGVSGTFGRTGPSQEVLTYRLICPDEKAGGVIGKGGAIVKALKHETGCDIKVLERTADSDDRVIVISGPSHPDERISAPQDAVLRVQTMIIRAAPENKDQGPTGKIIVSSHQIGCLLGKGGAVIAEMRKSTGAYIRILGKDQTPQYAARNEEVVQINGDFDAVHEALFQITSRLRSHFFRDAFPSINHPSFPDQGPPFPPYMRREISPPGRYSSFNQFDAGIPPHGGFHPHDDHPPFMHDLHRPGFAHHIPERLPWGPQGVEGGGPLGFPEFSGVPQRRLGGFGGGSHQAIITSTTVEVVVPHSVVSAIRGEDGGCLKQIREISDAKIRITDTKPGAKETLIIISGTPDQTHAAQSLIQAFVISETES